MPDEQVKISIHGPDGVLKDVTPDMLTSLVSSTSRITEITLSYSRKLNTGNYQSEDFFNSMKLDFANFWALIPDEALVNPEKAAVVQRAFAQGALYRVGVSLRSCYQNVMYPYIERARAASAPGLPLIEAEFRAIDTIDGFDPFNTQGLRDASNK